MIFLAGYFYEANGYTHLPAGMHDTQWVNTRDMPDKPFLDDGSK